MSNDIFKFELGVTVKHVITGFEGIITGRVQYISGCNQYLVRTKVDKASKSEAEWLDEQCLNAVAGVKQIVLDPVANKRTPGADRQAPVK